MSIKKSEYKNFSWDLHKKAGHSPIVAQMELTYRCPLRCEHCYTDCYNNKEGLKRELSTRYIKYILDKCKADGVVWFCFTGGDPLVRKDFVEIYSYAKKLGFITSVFSSVTSLNQKILELFKNQPPFNIETTLNAADLLKYKEITKTNLFAKHVDSIKKLIKNKIPVRVKTQVTKQNVGQIDKIKELVESFGLDFRPSTMIYARLNHNTHPCGLRLDPKEAVRINKEYGFYDEETRRPHEKIKVKELIGKSKDDKLFKCAAGGHAFWITPEGKMTICSTLRRPDYDLLKAGHSVRQGFSQLNEKVHSMRFKTMTICRNCEYRPLCGICPARAYLETGSLEEPIEYFCRLTEETLKEYA